MSPLEAARTTEHKVAGPNVTCRECIMARAILAIHEAMEERKRDYLPLTETLVEAIGAALEGK